MTYGEQYRAARAAGVAEMKLRVDLEIAHHKAIAESLERQAAYDAEIEVTVLGVETYGWNVEVST